MFSSRRPSTSKTESFSKKTESFKNRAGKSSSSKKTSFKDVERRRDRLEHASSHPHCKVPAETGSIRSSLQSPIVTLIVGRQNRLFAAHTEILCLSPFFASALRSNFQESLNRQLQLPDEDPEIFSLVLEYLYKGDYTPKLLHDERKNAWVLEACSSPISTISSPISPTTPRSNRRTSPSTASTHTTPSTQYGFRNDSCITLKEPDDLSYLPQGTAVLKDTAIYCLADRFDLPDLKRLALRKQGLRSGIEVGTILSSARFAYAHTPESDSKMRAHYLALIVRARKTFKRSGTMQLEMQKGGRMWFDLFVAMCNHMDDLSEGHVSRKK